MFAVIRTGGKQYTVSVGDTIKVEKIKDVEEGKSVVFDDVLMLEDDKGNAQIGQPNVKGAKVKAKVLEQGRDKKITIIKYKSKKRYQNKKGHRQPYTKLEITEIKSGN